MLEVVRSGAGYTMAIQYLGKSGYQLMQPQTPTFLNKLDSNMLKNLCWDKWTFESLCEFQLYLQNHW